jgi:hypothetical protein
MKGQCKDCVHFEPTGDSSGQYGECRRHAPMPHVIDTSLPKNADMDPDTFWAWWPLVSAEEGCGEFGSK